MRYFQFPSLACENLTLRLRSQGWLLTAITYCLCVPTASMAQAKNQGTPAFDLYKDAQYDAAAARGLTDLLMQPWNHELRLMVADSLQRIGKNTEAKIQLETLQGTAVDKEARTRLSAIQTAYVVAGKSQSVSSSVAVVARPKSTSSEAIATNTATKSETVQLATGSEQTIIVPAQLSSTGPQSNSQINTRISTAVSVNSQAVITPSGALLQLSPFQYIPPAGSQSTDQATQIKRSAEQQRILDLNTAGDYQSVATEGLALKENGEMDDELKMIFANSLAWTGRLPEATQAYQELTTGKFSKEANIGLANIDRWLGYDQSASRVYQSILATDPENPDALIGLKLTSRELSPRTLLTYGGSTDSSDINVRTLTANHRWRDSSGANVMEVETSGIKASLPGIEVIQKDATFRYRSLEREYKPSFELSTIGDAVYGGVGMSFGDRPILVEAGVVNWGRFSNNPNALASKLSASHLGLQASQGFSFGKFVARVDGYGVSDGNTVVTSSLRYSTNWRPLGPHFKPLLAIETREAKFNTANYWSPAQGYGSITAGLLGEWGSDDWNIFVSGQLGWQLYGEAGDGWSWTAGGKRWITNDIAIGFSLWGLSSQRNNTPYRANTFAVSLEKLWK